MEVRMLALALVLPALPGPGTRASSAAYPETAMLRQEVTPDSVAREFQTGLRGAAWRALAQRLHPEGLARFRRQVDLFVAPDTTGYVLETLLPGTDRGALHTLSDEEVFTRALANLMTDMPGVRHALLARRVEILGSVDEAPDLAHVVYRNTDTLDGAVPELRVMIMKRSAGGWAVLETPELELLREALRGVIRGRGPPPPGVVDPL